MLLGISRVIPMDQMKPGKFYLRQSYGTSPVLFLLAQGVFDNGPAWRAVEFDPLEEHPISIAEMSNYGPVAELSDVHVRIDAPSLSGTAYTHSIRAPMLIVEDEEAYVVALTGWRGAMIIKISDGEIVFNKPQNWASFDRWQLVIEDGGEEIPIANFGSAP